MIQLEALSIQAGSTKLNVSFEVPSGSYAVLMGKTGSGKTTILETICGLRRPNSGRVVLDQEDVTGTPVSGRGIGYVPQDLALFPGLSVREHLAFALRLRKLRRSEIDDRVAQLADQLGLEHLLKRGPSALSGGEKQRVALGRALAFEPSVLLLDEPLSALDEATREEISELLRNLKRDDRTVLHVTHSAAEAKLLADKCFHLRGGEIRTEPALPV